MSTYVGKELPIFPGRNHFPALVTLNNGYCQAQMYVVFKLLCDNIVARLLFLFGTKNCMVMQNNVHRPRVAPIMPA